ncbi:MAG: hypothetical protein JW744_03795 [Candidatus Diapherotrites archaeon]|uniref:Uncharacterized protein n=1 Tax=Candidatus Iainarchaeum sp. TaxID=3101447 RepID=A0A939C7E2_9ARCH|nr:hypothetical protein [Candidatus Diapherotrites archaeon]
MAIALSQRGQAALTDALYFLLIAGALSTWLLYSSATYGQVVKTQLNKQYWQEYTRSALETIVYSSTPRDPEIPLSEATEVDYLLAALKEDYADDLVLDETKAVLFNQVKTVMEPLRPNFDYAFYIYVLDREEYAAAMLHISETSGTGLTGKSLVLSCTPPNKVVLADFLSRVGHVAPSSSVIRLSQRQGSDQLRLPAQATLVIWTPTATSHADLNCQEFTA